MAEAVRFELTKGYKPLPVFKTGAFNRSATLPWGGILSAADVLCKPDWQNVCFISFPS